MAQLGDEDRCVIGRHKDFSLFTRTDMYVWHGIRSSTERRLAGYIRAWQDAGYAFTYKVFPNMGHGTLAGGHTEQFRREMLTAHAQTLAKAGNKAGKETPYEGAY